MKKKTIKKLKLKESVQVAITAIVLFAILAGAMIIYTNKVEAINNGEMVVINQNQMDR